MAFKLWLILVAAVGFAENPSTLQLFTTLDSPQPLAKVVNVSGVVSGGTAGNYWFRFRTKGPDGSYNMIRDFSPIASLDWTVYDHEGTVEIEVTARDNATGATILQSIPFEWLAVATDHAMVTPTQHPMVYLYSAPPCRAGLTSRVQFSAAGGQVQQTPAKTCDGVHSMNFLISGVPADTEVNIEEANSNKSGVVARRTRRFRTRALPESAPYPAKVPLTSSMAGGDGLLLLCNLPPYPQSITDLNGNLVWYLPQAVSFITRPVAGGRFLAIFQPNSSQADQRFIEFDLMGMILKDTNASRVNEQLQAMGKNPITSFHHEARRLPNGNFLVLASQERILTGVQGAGPVDILSDMILVLDQDLQVLWAWDAFDWLDPHRMAVLNEGCALGGCPPLYLAKQANDWTHGNAVQLAPDGSLLYSARHQDWVIKINYQNGAGDGRILWRLGKDGDFFMDSTSAAPWFSHQHDAHFLAGDTARVQLFDNGNTRQAADPGAHSRGQLVEIDEAKRIARLNLSADLGTFSFALGAAQQLSNGNYHFAAGWLPDVTSRHYEIDPNGTIVRTMNFPQTVYRSFRLADIYSESE